MGLKLEINIENDEWGSSIKINDKFVKCFNFDLHINPYSSPILNIEIPKYINGESFLDDDEFIIKQIDSSNNRIKNNYDDVQKEISNYKSDNFVTFQSGKTWKI